MVDVLKALKDRPCKFFEGNLCIVLRIIGEVQHVDVEPNNYSGHLTVCTAKPKRVHASSILNFNYRLTRWVSQIVDITKFPIKREHALV